MPSAFNAHIEIVICQPNGKHLQAVGWLCMWHEPTVYPYRNLWRRLPVTWKITCGDCVRMDESGDYDIPEFIYEPDTA